MTLLRRLMDKTWMTRISWLKWWRKVVEVSPSKCCHLIMIPGTSPRLVAGRGGWGGEERDEGREGGREVQLAGGRVSRSKRCHLTMTPETWHRLVVGKGKGGGQGWGRRDGGEWKREEKQGSVTKCCCLIMIWEASQRLVARRKRTVVKGEERGGRTD